MKTCKRVIYTGRVQGVGFRYTAKQLAGAFPVDGYVRNRPDGAVELVAHGDATDVDSFLQSVAERMHAQIAKQTVTEIESAEFDGFEIRF